MEPALDELTRIGIIGLGRAGGTHFDACKSLPGVEVAGVCDIAEPARRHARVEGCDVYTDVDLMLKHVRLDAVCICTPPADHARLAVKCLETGLHVLSEKPLALRTKDALRMFQAASRSRRRLLLATKFRHVPELALARDLIRAGEIGSPVMFEVSFCAPVDMSRRWNSQPGRAGGGVIIDNGCHAFDLVSFLFGSATRVQATALKPVQRLAVEDSATIQIQAGDGVVGRADLSWSLATGRDTYVVVHGSRGTIEVGWSRSRVKVAGRQWREIGGPYDKLNAHRRMNATFLQTIANGGRPWISALECLHSVAAVEAAYRSVSSGSWERVEIPEFPAHSQSSAPAPAEPSARRRLAGA